MIKKICLFFAFLLLFTGLVPTAAFSAYEDYSVERINCTVELLSDGSAIVTEDRTVSFSGRSDGFSHDIIIPGDAFETFDAIGDISVSVDGNVCSEASSDDALNNTFSVSRSDSAYHIEWFEQSENTSMVFSVRYVMYSAVKLYNEKAYFTYTAVNEDSGLVCRDVNVEIKTPAEVFAEDFEIVLSESLVGKKSDSSVSFYSANTAGEVKICVAMPHTVFDTQELTVIEDDNTVLYIVLSVLGVTAVFVAVFSVYYIKNYKRLFRKKWEKKCRKKALDESSYKRISKIFRKISTAAFLNLVSAETLCRADRFIVNLLELIKRGYIEVTDDGFIVNESSVTDTTDRKKDSGDKFILDTFADDSWKALAENPESFYEHIEKYNRTTRNAGFMLCFTAKSKALVRHCFELSLSAGRHEFVLPEEISDDFFKDGKYNLTDLAVSVLNEYRLSLKKDFTRPDGSRYRRNMFMLRDLYEKGRSLHEHRLSEEMKQRESKRNKREVDDDLIPE